MPPAIRPRRRPVNVTVSNAGTPPPVETIVLDAADVPTGEHLRELGQEMSDTTAADNIAMVNTTTTAAKIDPASRPRQNLTSTSTFDAPANTRVPLVGAEMKAANTNDELDPRAVLGQRRRERGAEFHTGRRPNSAEVVLDKDARGGTLPDGAGPTRGMERTGDPIQSASTGPHTLRVQQREDGPRFDSNRALAGHRSHGCARTAEERQHQTGGQPCGATACT